MIIMNATWDGCAFWRPIRDECTPPTCVPGLVRYCVAAADLDDAQDSWEELLLLTNVGHVHY